MGKLRNPKHEGFCRAIVFRGKDLAEAYVDAGFDPNSITYKNHNRLRRRPDVEVRIRELTQERELAARAARTPIADVLAELATHGIDRVADFFQPDAGGNLVVRDLSIVRAQVALSLLNALHDGTGLIWDRSQFGQLTDLQLS
jgi:hypothetical protein